jgi:hypothetical protein
MISTIDLLAALLVFGPLYTVILWHWANYRGFKRGLDVALKMLKEELKTLEDKRTWNAKRSSSSYDE